MDRFAPNGWFMKFSAFVMAFLLFLSVNYDPADRKSNTSHDTPSQSEAIEVENVPVEVYYDVENLVVSGAPSTVNVKLTGPKSILLSTKNKRDFHVYIDLSDPVIGSQKVPLKVKNLSDKLNYSIDPASVTVHVEEKVTKDYSVEAEFDENALGEGYKFDKPVVEPSTVNITGAKSIMDKIAVVKATMRTEGTITNDIIGEATVQVLDQNLNRLDVDIKPQTVNVSIDVSSPSKEVGLKPIAKGTLPEGVTIESMKINPTKATIYGSKDVLGKVSQIEVPVEIGNIKDDTKLDIPFSLPDGIVGASVDTVEVSVNVKKDEKKDISRTLSNIPIELRGIDEDQYEANFIEPANGKVSLVVKGDRDRIQSLKTSDFELYLNMANVSEGKHRLVLNVNGPDKVQWELPKNTRQIYVELIKKNPDG